MKYTYREKYEMLTVDGEDFNCSMDCVNKLNRVVEGIYNPELEATGLQMAVQRLYDSEDAINNPQLFYNIIKSRIDKFNSLSDENQQYIQQGLPIPPENKLPVNYAYLVKRNTDLLKWLELYIKKYVSNPEINTPIDYANSIEQNNELLQRLDQSINKLTSSTQKKNTQKEIIQTNLMDIWNDENHYNLIIEFLKEENPTLQSPFVSVDKNNNLTWTVPNYQYLGAFIKKCKSSGYLKNITITAKEWVAIVNKTFNLNINPNNEKLFRKNKTFDSLYLDVFENLPRI